MSQEIIQIYVSGFFWFCKIRFWNEFDSFSSEFKKRLKNSLKLTLNSLCNKNFKDIRTEGPRNRCPVCLNYGDQVGLKRQIFIFSLIKLINHMLYLKIGNRMTFICTYVCRWGITNIAEWDLKQNLHTCVNNAIQNVQLCMI